MDELGRRTILTAGLVTGLVACTTTDPAPPAPARFDPADWDDVRALFPLDPDLVHTAAFVLAAHPKPVADAIERHRAGLDADTEAYLHSHGTAEAELRKTAAVYLGGTPDQVAFTDSTTMGLGVLYSGMRLRAGQDVVTSTHDFVAHHAALDLMARRTGATVREVALYDDPRAADADEVVSRLRSAITANTRVVAITWVHSSTGVRLPVPAIAAMLADVNTGRAPEDRALLCVDGVHGFGAVDIAVADLGCDFLSSGTHKWLFGPRGTGVLWGRAWDALDPVIPTFSEGSSPGARFTPGGYHSFEHRWALREAFELHERIGRGRIAERITVQATRLKEGLAKIPSITLITPDDPDMSAGIVCCEVDGMDAFTAVVALREAGVVASVTPYAQQYLRFGPSIVTTPDQVDKVVTAARALRP
ncbi:aminotransferase class V-fold PLP-dependent enzyme [Actinophytocola sp. NPDC049390]|uniref:aminotransferase class V-fold PLP-dependent enzyme n=1 Tax=Actinophytocola sp. NPDC049390 TaxID=3363894 RepID=UPI0037919A6E